MKKLLIFPFLLFVSAICFARVTTFAWDRSDTWPANTTVELCSNGICVQGLTSTSHTMDVPVAQGDNFDVTARAYSQGYTCGEPLEPCEYSEWATFKATFPINGSNISLSLKKASDFIYTLFPSDSVPTMPSAGDTQSVVLGVKFKASASGKIVGIKFYKGSCNTGNHTGKLWSNNGTMLGETVFSETQSGWQSANFSTPIQISANTVYIASYIAPVGCYSLNSNYFTNDYAPASTLLMAPSSSNSGGNGVYVYNSSHIFPSSSWNSSNYWVDVIFVPD